MNSLSFADNENPVPRSNGISFEYAKFLKDLLSDKKKLEEEMISHPYQVSSILQGKMPT